MFVESLNLRNPGNGKPYSQRDLAGRIAVIRGGARGIGRAIAEGFLREGAAVILLDGDEGGGKATTAELTASSPAAPVIFLKTDLRRPGDIQSAMELVRKDHHKVDVLVNNAGVEIGKPLSRITVED